MHFYQRVIIHYTHFFLPPLFPSGPSLSYHHHPLSWPMSVLLFYALNHQQRCRTELKHRMCCIYRIRHDPAACPGLFPLPIHILLLFRSPFHFPLISHSCFPCCCPYPVVRVHLTCWGGAERGTRMLSWLFLVECVLARQGERDSERAGQRDVFISANMERLAAFNGSRGNCFW